MPKPPKATLLSSAKRPRFTHTERNRVFAKVHPGNGRGGLCWHCGKALARNNFHVDHHPVVFSDIENQLCLGVTNPKEMSNLVPSCPECNVSHVHEHPKTMYCNHTQIQCSRRVYAWILFFVYSAMLLLVGWVI